MTGVLSDANAPRLLCFDIAGAGPGSPRQRQQKGLHPRQAAVDREPKVAISELAPFLH
jgi:hypothetical protein